MPDLGQNIKNIISKSLPDLLFQAIQQQVEAAGGTARKSGNRISWSIPQNENNTYEYQTTAEETVPASRKKDGTYIKEYKRKAPPIPVLTDENLINLNAAASNSAEGLKNTLANQLN
jgi:hypothetical protein